MTTETALHNLLMRPPTEGDLPAIFEVIVACDTALYGVPDTTWEDFWHDWHEPKFNMATDAWLVFAPDGRLIAHASTWYHQPIQTNLALYCHPEFFDPALEKHLLELTEDRARQNIPLCPPQARVSAEQWLDHESEASARVAVEAGYKLERNFWRMLIELQEQLPLPQWADGLSVRTFKPDQEIRAVFEAKEEAFGDHWGHLPNDFSEWKQEYVERENFDPTLWFVMMDGDEIAAGAFCKIFLDMGWVNTLFVRRKWRKQGAGLALLYHVFAEFRERGFFRVGLGVDASSLTGATRLYEKAGMHVARRYDFYRKTLRDGEELSTQTLPD